MTADQQAPARSGNDRSEDDAIREIIAALETEGELDHRQTTFVRDRWMGQLTWFEGKAARNQREMHRYRVILLAGGVALPVLVNLAATRSEWWIEAAAVALSLVVGFVAGLEAFRKPGEKWLQYRQTAEQLRAEFWLYVNLAGPRYDGFPSMADAFETFVLQVQALLEEDVTGFVTMAKKALESSQARVTPGRSTGSGT